MKNVSKRYNSVGALWDNAETVSFYCRRLLEYIDVKQPTNPGTNPSMLGSLCCSCPIVWVDAGYICYTVNQAAGFVAAASGDSLISWICVGMIGIGHDNDGNTDYIILEADNAYIKIGKWWIAFDAIKGHINDQCSRACDAFAASSAEDKDATICSIATFSIDLVDG